MLLFDVPVVVMPAVTGNQSGKLCSRMCSHPLPPVVQA